MVCVPGFRAHASKYKPGMEGGGLECSEESCSAAMTWACKC